MRKPKSKDPTAPYRPVKTPFTKAEHLLKRAQTEITKLQKLAEDLKVDAAALDRASEELESFAQSVRELEK